jgi:hypothetical protein
MTARPLETVAVYADLEHFEAPAQMGSLRRHSSRSYANYFLGAADVSGCSLS